MNVGCEDAHLRIHCTKIEGKIIDQNQNHTMLGIQIISIFRFHQINFRIFRFIKNRMLRIQICRT